MPVGIIINCLSVAVGGAAGALFGKHIPEKLKTELTMVFGLCAIGMGINSVVLMKNMPAVIFAVVIGTALGLICSLGQWIQKGAGLLRKPVAKLFPGSCSGMEQGAYMAMLVSTIVLFCASGTGIYGSLDSGISGDHTILISKSILDFFTAMIFACSLGMAVPVIAAPQFVIFMAIFLLARFIYPFTTPDMIADFKACGGFLLIATGLRITQIRIFPVADMIPAMVLVMPISWAWTNWILPVL